MKLVLCTYGKYTAVTEGIFMKLITEWWRHYMCISCAEFELNRLRNANIKNGSSCGTISKVGQDIYATDFHENHSCFTAQ